MTRSLNLSASELRERGFDPLLAETVAQVAATGPQKPRDHAALDAASDMLFSRSLRRVACALVGLNLGLVASWMFNQSAVAAIHPYGAGQCLTAAQIITARHLAFPQSHRAITSALGSPEGVDRHHNWYCLPNSRQYLVIRYNRQGQAVAMGWSR